MQALSTRLQNTKVNDLVKRVADVISHRLRSSPHSVNGSILARSHDQEILVDRDTAAVYVKAYFDRVHPFYPFLDQSDFESALVDPDLPRRLSTNKAFSALYHSVLALGSQYCGYGSFEPGKSRSWQLFSVALALFPDLLTLPDSLLTLQALTSMAIFALSVSCIQIEHLIISEGARRAQKVSFGQPRDGGLPDSYGRVFWVLYTIEKTSSFYYGRSSIFNDSDIGHPVPAISEAFFGDYNWFLASARHARLLSRAYTSLFSIGVTGNSREYFSATIDQLHAELEQWRLSIPAALRPGTAFWLPERSSTMSLSEPVSGHTHTHTHTPLTLMTPVALWTHYLYHSVLLALARATLHLDGRPSPGEAEAGASDPNRLLKSKQAIMNASRSILELTRFIDVEPYTPVWVLVGIPVAALFILFDLIIHNPKHPETGSNLALLHVASGHFSRIEYASCGGLPGSMISEFAFIANEYVKTVQLSSASEHPPEVLKWPTLDINGNGQYQYQRHQQQHQQHQQQHQHQNQQHQQHQPQHQQHQHQQHQHQQQHQQQHHHHQQQQHLDYFAPLATASASQSYLPTNTNTNSMVSSFSRPQPQSQPLFGSQVDDTVPNPTSTSNQVSKDTPTPINHVVDTQAQTPINVVDNMFYPIDDPYYMQNDPGSGSLMGTNIIDLFGSVVPGLDFNLGPWGGWGGGQRDQMTSTSVSGNVSANVDADQNVNAKTSLL
ncbi:hypothetical protein A1O3_02968 [Capronia epimyces CBS 606.96]|uniref:Xylanolytic transcriptional activator regulatory domain-containing protein n=1 Tax=Capronia epimyces CBS 606.96 TaxID=1182542 RepID=W9YL02_9EURO|nr:uncharacterized protein A1O3_02968 [Capronia epimyces CBS 606.96]EXJ89901.1 hypothetical protein A1O3_02968 [Capronia epimyces CBS 606.96]